jgi:hypothetical protein
MFRQVGIDIETVQTIFSDEEVAFGSFALLFVSASSCYTPSHVHLRFGLIPVHVMFVIVYGVKLSS